MTKAEIREMAPGRQVQARRWLGVRASAFGIDSSFGFRARPRRVNLAIGERQAGSRTLFGASMLGAESDGTPDARTIYYNFPTSGDGAVIGRLDKSGDVSGLASRHGDSTWRAGGPMRRFRK